ncbi:hypothetical protein [Puniceicoccus vermicola]|uniref:HTH psq-type domain-containing protein n=1 Tax=Puniceicoccus vermicola TaxID=388746 RepID=A0A7X1AYK1_9BACT|nr:hypothetical protein [Puniceicoccus vermicola]MBC2602366.1 hypothetical protein [Puniceicoccus vermicola]
MTQDISSEIRRLEQEAAKLEKQKAELLKKQEEQEKELKKLDSLVADSGFDSAKQLIEALMVRFKIAPSQLNKKSASISSGRTRTTVTAELRDKISADLASGMSKTAIGEKYNVSYLVVRGVETGKYKDL